MQDTASAAHLVLLYTAEQGQTADGQGAPDVALSVGFTIWAMCLVKEDTCAVSSLIAARLACNLVSALVCLAESLRSS